MTLDTYQKRAAAMQGFHDRMESDLTDLRTRRSDCIHAAKVMKGRCEPDAMLYWLQQAQHYHNRIMGMIRQRRSVQRRADILQSAADLERLNTSRQAAE